MITYQILSALSAMNHQGIVHRDIKPENILIQRLNPMIEVLVADFGVSIRMDDKQQGKRVCGTPGYCAPEYLNEGIFSEKSDIFSLGSLIYNLLSGHSLFEGNNMKEVIFNN